MTDVELNCYYYIAVLKTVCKQMSSDSFKNVTYKPFVYKTYI